MNYYTTDYESQPVTATAAQHINNLDHIQCDFLNLPKEMREENEDINEEIERMLEFLDNIKPERILNIQYNENINTFTWEFI